MGGNEFTSFTDFGLHVARSRVKADFFGGISCTALFPSSPRTRAPARNVGAAAAPMPWPLNPSCQKRSNGLRRCRRSRGPTPALRRTRRGPRFLGVGGICFGCRGVWGDFRRGSVRGSERCGAGAQGSKALFSCTLHRSPGCFLNSDTL